MEKRGGRILKGKICEYAIVYMIGSVGYCAIELLWRGYSHWTMTVTGGVCFMIIYLTNRMMRSYSVFKKCLVCAVDVTAIELMVGCIVNVLLGWNVWDYSDQPFSFMGQICPGFFVLWFLLVLPVIIISDTMQKSIFGDMA